MNRQPVLSKHLHIFRFVHLLAMIEPLNLAFRHPIQIISLFSFVNIFLFINLIKNTEAKTVNWGNSICQVTQSLLYDREMQLNFDGEFFPIVDRSTITAVGSRKFTVRCLIKAVLPENSLRWNRNGTIEIKTYILVWTNSFIQERCNERLYVWLASINVSPCFRNVNKKIYIIVITKW